MNPKWIVSLGIVFASIHVARSHCAESPGPLNTTALVHLAKSMNQFSADFHRIQSNATTGNFVASPLSAAMVLMMAGLGAQGTTANEISRVLHTQTSRECDIRALIQRLHSYTNVELSLVNKIFAANHFDVKSEFLEDTKFVFNSDVKKLDFSQSTQAANEINAWCENQTNSRIKDIIKPDNLDDNTALVLINAIYFKGQWAKQFDDFSVAPFYSANGSKKDVPSIIVEDQYRHGTLSEISARFLEIPYESKVLGDSVSMFVILPNDRDGLRQVENHIQEVSLETLNSGTMARVRIVMPKFKIESEIQLTDVLESLGMSEIFSESADFSGISDAKVKVSKAVQKTFLKVDENGSEAAAASTITVDLHSLKRTEVYFNVDHPFLVLIASKDVVFFSGRVVDIE